MASELAMSNDEEQRMSHLDTYVCPNCSRRCLWVHQPGDAPAPRCVCGAVLDATLLPLGVYEVVGAPAHDERSEEAALPGDHGEEAAPPDRSEEAALPGDEPASDIRQEADIGYGASHGYSPGHGGPTGPGDAPARSNAPAGGDAPASGDAPARGDAPASGEER